MIVLYAALVFKYLSFIFPALIGVERFFVAI